ncbi:MAG TPA: porin [Vicinamibacterales bacterium]|nr:porin [Vicinamibacterales bacterium]
MKIAHLTIGVLLAFSAGALAQTPENVTIGVQSFMQYTADLHEPDHYNAFDVTRGYLNITGKLSDAVSFRFTPDVQPTTDLNLNRNLTLLLAYAALYAKVGDKSTVMFGLHETPWLTYEESVNRYRVIGPFFSERLGLIPGPTDLGASLKVTGERTEVHVGIYNGEGYGRAEQDKFKNIDGRVSFHPFSADSEAGNVGVSVFYQYGWYAQDRPRNVLIVMGSYDKPNVAVTGQYLQATDNPFVARDIQRRGLSFFGEVRQGLTGWAGIAQADYFQPDVLNENDSRRRYLFGGAHWSRLGRGGRLGVVVSISQDFQGTTTSELTGRQLMLQTHVEF